MSSYRNNYTSWNKGNTSSTYSGSSSSKSETSSSKYEPAYSRSGSDAKRTSDGGSSLRLGQKYGSYSGGYQRDGSASRDAGKYSGSANLTSRLKETLEKKDTSHPPISYRPITTRSGSRSRDPSVERDSSDRTTLGSHTTYNRLYPGPYNTRSVSRERTESTSSNSASTIPKYTGRSSLTKDDKYSLGRTSRNESREDLSASKFKTATAARAAAQDLDTGSKKYITSRFLPKNTIEKSHTAYTRPTSTRIASSQRETSRKNRELLNLISAQNDSTKGSRPVSRCSSTLSEDSPREKPKLNQSEDNQDVETVTVITRCTSPNVPTQASFLKGRRADMARIVEKQVTRPKNRDVEDKQIQSDRPDSRISNTSATPWSSYLDLKFSSPGNDTKSTKSSGNSSQSESSKQKQSQSNSNSPKSLSRNNSTKSLNRSNSRSELESKSNSKSKISAPKSSQKQLPPQIPAFIVPNKDFRKSVLNMNPDGTNKKSQRSNSVSSADSEIEIPVSEATDVSENLSSCKSFHKTTSSSVSKLPKRTTSEATDSRSRRSNTRSPSVPSEGNSSSTAATSGSEDDSKSKSSKSKPDNKQKKRNIASSRTSLLASSADEAGLEKSPKPPISPRPKNDGGKSETEAKSFLMRALAPVTSLFKVKYHGSSDKINWMDSSSENASELKSKSQTNNDSKYIISQNESGERVLYMEQNQEAPGSNGAPEPPKRILCRIESGEKRWWLEDCPSKSESISNGSRKSNGSGQKVILTRTESGEKAWWLNENAQVPEDVQVYSVVERNGSEEKGKKKILCRVESGEKAWWLEDNSDVPEGVEVYPVLNKPAEENIMSPEFTQKYKIRHIDSGERSWWLNSTENILESANKEEEQNTTQPTHQRLAGKWWLGSPGASKQNSQDTDSDSDGENEIPLGDRASPEGLEMPKEDEERVASPYDNVPSIQMKPKRPDTLFISRHKNIDDILGGASHSLSPLMDRIFGYHDKEQFLDDCEEVNPDQVKIHDSTPQRGIIQPNRVDIIGGFPKTSAAYGQLDDASLQLYKDGDYGSYLDLEASISEQQEEFEGFQSNKKNSIVLRTQLSVRVHTIIEKLLTSEGRELRRALFSLKQIFQEDKDLVHEFVQNDGLACLIKVGSEADQNYQNYILRALGQVMLYVDGMNGVIHHNETVQWLYSLISSKFRLVVKTALKLLLVFVEYVDSNCLLLIKAVHAVDSVQGLLSWYNVMKLLKDFDSADTELLIYAMTLINKCFNGIPDQDTYYDQTDALEEQGIEGIIQRYMSKPGTDLDLLQQFQIYEAVLQYEDSEEKGIPLRHLDESVRKTLRSRKSVVVSSERRKSRRHSTGTTPFNSSLNMRKNLDLQANAEDDESSSSQSSAGPNDVHLNGSYKENNKASEAGVTPALRRRRERAERQRSFMREQQETAALFRESAPGEDNHEKTNGNYTNALQQRIPNGNMLNKTSSRKDLTPLMNAVNKLESEDSSLTKQPWILSMMYGGKTIDDQNQENLEDANENDRRMLLQLKRENTVKDLTQKLANQNALHSPSEENKMNRIGDMSGLISKAKEGLAKSKSKADVLKSPTSENIPKAEAKKSENELRWEELVNSLNRPLNLCDLDFTDLGSDDETDVLAPAAATNGIPPPPPPLMGDMLAPPPPPLNNRIPPPAPNPPVFGINLQRSSKQTESKIPIKKNKKTVKLFWKEVRDDAITAMKLKTGLIWDELAPVTVDTQKLEHLFESRAKDLITKKQQELNKNKEIIVLDPKRSNAINIGMTKLPPPRSIKTAILKMDATIMNREGIEKLLTMLPTEEERTKIQEAQAASPDLPLGSAEQFLLTLASISELPARLNLWAFKLDFENTEREIAEPLMDLKQGFEVLKVNKSFRCILGTLLSIGIFLNGAEVKGFQIEYLAKVPEVKDTVHKHSLLHHLCHIVMEKFPDSTDLYSEIGAITRASKIDFDELALNIQRLEADCKASWDHLKLIAKHDGSTMMKIKMSDFLADCAERIILLGIIHRRVMNRFHRFLLWLGIPLHQISDTKPNEFCRIVSEFALEYRTTRERVLQQLEKKANHRERNKTRGKMITEIGKFRTKEERTDAELRQLLGSDNMSDVESLQGTLPWRRRSRDTNRSFLSQANGNLTDGDDEILESLVKTATKGPSRTAPRERKRTRHADRKSLRRTLKNGLSEEEKKHLSAYIKSY